MDYKTAVYRDSNLKVAPACQMKNKSDYIDKKIFAREVFISW